MEDLHRIQMRILRELIFRPNSRFSELNTLDLTSDHFTYHLNRLVETGLVTKDSGQYSLTTLGKKLAGQMDTDKIKIQEQAKIGVLACGYRQVNRTEKFLVQTRLKEPFYGYQGFPAGKIKLGETVLAAAQREFKEETRLTGKPGLFAIYHLRHYAPDKTLLKDQFFFAVKFVNPTGKLLQKHEEGENNWFSYSQLKAVTKPFPDFFQLIDDLRAGEFVFREQDFLTKEF